MKRKLMIVGFGAVFGMLAIMVSMENMKNFNKSAGSTVKVAVLLNDTVDTIVANTGANYELMEVLGAGNSVKGYANADKVLPAITIRVDTGPIASKGASHAIMYGYTSANAGITRVSRPRHEHLRAGLQAQRAKWMPKSQIA